ncbi:MAG: hypothetical protein R2729_30750 [Bryobacteraceae bacterium]
MADKDPRGPRSSAVESSSAGAENISVRDLLKDPKKQKELKKEAIRKGARRRAEGGLRPDEIGLVRVQFSLPASRLFGGDGLLTTPGGTSRIIADNNTDDPVVVGFDGDPSDPVITVNPGPGHFDGIDS